MTVSVKVKKTSVLLARKKIANVAEQLSSQDAMILLVKGYRRASVQLKLQLGTVTTRHFEPDGDQRSQWSILKPRGHGHRIVDPQQLDYVSFIKGLNSDPPVQQLDYVRFIKGLNSDPPVQQLNTDSAFRNGNDKFTNLLHNGHTTTEIVTTTLNSTPSQAATTVSPTCYTIRSHTICKIPEATVIGGHTTTEMMTTTLSPTSPQSSTSPVITTAPKPTGSMYGVYIALWSNIETIQQPEGLPPQFIYEYNDLIWVSAVPATASDNLLTGPQYCSTKGVDSTITITHIPTIDQLYPYPTASITSLRPSGTSGPSCDWIPSPNNDEPGSLSCDISPTSVDCSMPLQPTTTCGSVDTEVEPLVQCIWQGE
ncbi:MAG: hypothetical protein Q9161_007503 [Pseudevernia consocians]